MDDTTTASAGYGDRDRRRCWMLVDRKVSVCIQLSEGKDMSQKQEQAHIISGNTPALPDPLSVIVLGSGGPAAAGRASSGYLVLVGGEARFLLVAPVRLLPRFGQAAPQCSKLSPVPFSH